MDDREYKSYCYTSLIYELKDPKASYKPLTSSARLSSKKLFAHVKPKTRSPSLKSPLTDLTPCQGRDRHLMAKSQRNQIDCEKEVASFQREKRKAMHQLQNSKSYYTRLLGQIQDCQMKILKSKEQDQILLQAESRYSKAPVLETKRFCGACARRPKSAINATSGNFTGYHSSLVFNKQRQQVEQTKPFITRKVKSAGATPTCSKNLPIGSCHGLSETIHRPSPIVSPLTSRCVSPIKLFDFSSISDLSNDQKPYN